MNLVDKAELAFVSVIHAAIPSALVLPGKSAEVKTLPIVVCYADGTGQEDPPFSGNCWLNVSIEVKENTIGTIAHQQELHGQVETALKDNSDLPAALTAAVSDFTVFPNGVLFDSPDSGRDPQGVWVDVFHLRVYCCNSAIAS